MTEDGIVASAQDFGGQRRITSHEPYDLVDVAIRLTKQFKQLDHEDRRRRQVFDAVEEKIQRVVNGRARIRRDAG